MPAIHMSPEAAEAAVAAAEPHYKQTNVASIVEAKVKNPAQPDPQPTLKNRGHPITVKKSVAAQKKTGTKLQNKKKEAGKETNSESSAIPRCSPGGADGGKDKGFDAKASAVALIRRTRENAQVATFEAPMASVEAPAPRSLVAPCFGRPFPSWLLLPTLQRVQRCPQDRERMTLRRNRERYHL